MTKRFQRITPFLWFDSQAEEAANYYASIFPDSSVGKILRYDEASSQGSGRPVGSVLTVDFKLDGCDMVALNGGPHFKFNEAVSLMVNCESQDEVEHYWKHLTAGGDPAAQQCGWLKDKYGVSWQVVPVEMLDLISDPDPVRAGKAMKAMMQMKKLDVNEMRRAMDA
ncbi:VOC family protein [Lysobacter sp. GCM10012299]|uniref:VOC family protein n=1 Tax=Lysobacter sp. GCM10012299 TaxID=3317333 RepID=UPI003609504D